MSHAWSPLHTFMQDSENRFSQPQFSAGSKTAPSWEQKQIMTQCQEPREPVTSLTFLNGIKNKSLTNQSKDSRSLTWERTYWEKTRPTWKLLAILSQYYILSWVTGKGEIFMFILLLQLFTTTGNRVTSPSMKSCQFQETTWPPHTVSLHSAD